jgi:MEMO1 family protein
MPALMDVRPSPIAGRWYEGNPERLALQMDALLEKAANPPLTGEVIGLVAPHAGHRYSGFTAAHAFKTVKDHSYDLVIIVSPFHDMFPGSLITTAHKAYSTPLGEIPVDETALEALDTEIKKLTGSQLNRVIRDGEHSLEIELPFLQRSLQGPFSLLPVMVRSRNASEMEALGESLAMIAAKRETLLVASSDLSHFYPENQADDLDAYLESQIEALSPSGVLDADITGRGYACGAGAISAVLWAALCLKANRAILLHHSNSAAETGDHQSVVGYGSAVILRI